MRRTIKPNTFYKPQTGHHKVTVKDIHTPTEKSTRWEFKERIGESVEYFSLFLREGDEAKILAACGVEQGQDGAFVIDTDELLGIDLDIEVKQNGDFINLVSVSQIKSSDDIEFGK